LFALEIWQQTFHDRAAHWRTLGARLKRPDSGDELASSRLVVGS